LEKTQTPKKPIQNDHQHHKKLFPLFFLSVFPVLCKNEFYIYGLETAEVSKTDFKFDKATGGFESFVYYGV